MARTFKDRRHHGIINGYRSGLEDKIAKDLTSKGVRFSYESLRLAYKPTKTKHYTPDFRLGDSNIIVESKGWFKSSDRSKMLLVRDQNPEWDIRLLFSNAKNRISKTSQTTYAKWADDHGFKWTEKDIPQAWLDEAKAG